MRLKIGTKNSYHARRRAKVNDLLKIYLSAVYFGGRTRRSTHGRTYWDGCISRILQLKKLSKLSAMETQSVGMII